MTASDELQIADNFFDDFMGELNKTNQYNQPANTDMNWINNNDFQMDNNDNQTFTEQLVNLNQGVNISYIVQNQDYNQQQLIPVNTFDASQRTIQNILPINSFQSNNETSNNLCIMFDNGMLQAAPMSFVNQSNQMSPEIKQQQHSVPSSFKENNSKRSKSKSINSIINGNNGSNNLGPLQGQIETNSHLMNQNSLNQSKQNIISTTKLVSLNCLIEIKSKWSIKNLCIIVE